MGTSELPALSSLTLTVTERCNLRCAYCYVPFERGRVMAPEVVDAAVDLLERHAGDSPVTLSFFGGEPMLAADACQRAVRRARRALDGKRRLRVLLPSNGLALRHQLLRWLRSEGVELALSIDGDAGESARRFADGRPAAERLLPLVPEVLQELGARQVLARMTVTPENVQRLASNVRALARLGFRRIVYLVDYDAAWDDDAIAAWGREHRRLGTWGLGAAGAGKRLPDLPGWRAIAERLASGRPRQGCGAGRRIAAVSTDGGLYPCYRLVFEPDSLGARLGDVRAGFTEREALARFAEFDPERVRPEGGACASCSARDACTHSCPALGLARLGDVNAVPSVACRLMREQVAAIRPYVVGARRRRRAPPRVGAALVAAAVTAASALSACGGSTESRGSGGPSAEAGRDGVADSADDFGGGGVCPVWTDAGGDAGSDTGGGGLCPVWADAGSDASLDTGGGGVCPVFVDAGSDVTEDVGGGGLCRVLVDGGSDASDDAEAGTGGGGLCPVYFDAGVDEGGAGGSGGGLCPYNGGGGIC